MAITNADGSIVLTTKVDQSGLKSGMSTMKSGVSSISGAVGKLGAAMAAAFSVKVLIDFSKEASNLATTTEASVQRLIDIYGSASKAVGDFIDANANALGMSRAAAASYASVYGNLFSVWADQRTNAALTTQYLNMTSVVASKTGRTVEDVQERVRSGLLGNTEAIEDLGIFVNVKTIEITDAFKRMAGGKSWEQLDAYTQQQIRSMAILEQATAKYGDEVAKTSALTKAQFQAAWQDFQATWGQVVNRVLMPVLEVLTDIVVEATYVIQALSGISGALISNGDSASDFFEEQKKLNDELNETKDALLGFAGFDEVQTISINTDTNDSGNNYQNFNIEGILNNISNVSGDISELSGALDSLKNIDLSKTRKALASLNAPLKKFEKLGWDTMYWGIQNVISPISGFVIENVLPAYFETFSSVLDIYGTTINDYIEVYKQFFDEFLTPIAEYAKPQIISILETLKTNINNLKTTLSESTAFEGFKSIMSNIYDILEPLARKFIDFATPIAEFAINSAFTDLNYLLKDISDILSVIADLINGDVDSALSHLKNLFSNIFIERPAEIFQNISDAVKELIGWDLSGWVDSSWGALKSFFYDKIIPIINFIIDGINKISITIPNWSLLPEDVRGKSWGFDISKIEIPQLAQGAVIPGNREFIALLGDQPAGQTNIETPLETMIEAFQMALDSRARYGGNTEVVLEIDGREFGRAVVEQGNRENRRIGTKLVVI